jgi:hypothetical protein
VAAWQRQAKSPLTTVKTPGPTTGYKRSDDFPGACDGRPKTTHPDRHWPWGEAIYDYPEGAFVHGRFVVKQVHFGIQG